ncbi:Fic family protein [Flavobacterium chungbukense]|uniref:Fic family protein n=1 Tax=Flavobacterium chungbukense TaxID=877464 RepID=UPI001E4619EF|nr:Fic family protein [Flavobacterium chungbukense]MCC4921575.1 Fic family protein [Flavobacterium chungbukense]
MATPSENLAASLQVLQELQQTGIIAIPSRLITRTHRERLVKKGFLREVMRGWYIPSRPDETPGESTSWYASYWNFAGSYLTERFGREWCLSPEESAKIHAANLTVPAQLLVRAPQGRNQITNLLHNTAILEVRSNLPEENQTITDKNGLRLYSTSACIVNLPENFYQQNPTDARTLLSTFRDGTEILALLLDGGKSVVAGRIAGAFRNIDRPKIANDILNGMKAADYNVRELDPFTHKSPIIFSQRQISPHVNRMELMWNEMREEIIKVFPPAPGLPTNQAAYLKQVEDNYINDAYNSLSIEGYRVNTELIERVRSGTWQPDINEQDRQTRDAMAARGYWQAFQMVQKTIEAILGGTNPGTAADNDHATWYREMFAPSVTAGIIKPSDLAGYRNQPIYIRGSKHVPPAMEAVRDLMPAFFDLLATEENAGVRVVLGHFFFVFIHPYSDGNGRIGRFLMNSMMASGGYPWTVIPLERRAEYMASLESASAGGDIIPFASFIASLL